MNERNMKLLCWRYMQLRAFTSIRSFISDPVWTDYEQVFDEFIIELMTQINKKSIQIVKWQQWLRINGQPILHLNLRELHDFLSPNNQIRNYCEHRLNKNIRHATTCVTVTLLMIQFYWIVSIVTDVTQS